MSELEIFYRHSWKFHGCLRFNAKIRSESQLFDEIRLNCGIWHRVLFQHDNCERKSSQLLLKLFKLLSRVWNDEQFTSAKGCPKWRHGQNNWTASTQNIGENARAVFKRITRAVSVVAVEVCSAEMTVDRYCGERAYAPYVSFSILFYRHHKNKARFFGNADSSCVFSFRWFLH